MAHDPKSPETTVSAPDLINVAARTGIAVAAFNSLGLVDDMPAATEHIGLQMLALRDELKVQSPDVAVEPYIPLELSADFGLGDLIKAFDAKQRHDSYVNKSLWGQYTPGELNARRVGEHAVAVVNLGSGAARAMLLGGNRSKESGLYHTGKSTKKQIKAVTGQELVTPADYIILNAQRREAGEAQLDTSSFTRFVQLDKKTPRDFGWPTVAAWVFFQLGMIGPRFSTVTTADCYKGQLRLGGSGVGRRSNIGVRLSVGSRGLASDLVRMRGLEPPRAEAH